MRCSVLIVLVGCGRLGFDPLSSPPPVPDDAITTFTGPHADPTQLPLAIGQLEGNTGPGAMLGANQSYVDPNSGVRIWKLTDATFPEANSNGRVEREFAGAQVSAALGDNVYTVAVILEIGGVGRRFLIDVERDLGIKGTRELVVQGGEDMMAFSADPTAPHILFAGDGLSRLHRIDTTTNTIADLPPFPVGDVYTLPFVTAAARVVVAQSRNTGFLAINTTTGAVDELVTGGDQIPSVDHDGLFVTTRTSGPGLLWRIGETGSSQWMPPSGDFQASTGVSGGFVAVDVDTGSGDMAFWYSEPALRRHTKFGSYGGYDDVGLAAQWIQTDVAADQQWVLYTVAERNFGPTGPLDDAIGFLRLDGDFRFLAHHYAPDNPGYYDSPRAGLSPDGHMVVFTSTMGTGRTDVYLAQVPLSP